MHKNNIKAVIEDDYFNKKFFDVSVSNKVNPKISYKVAFDQKLKTQPQFEVHNHASCSITFRSKKCKTTYKALSRNELSFDGTFSLDRFLKNTSISASHTMNWSLAPLSTSVKLKNKGNNHKISTAFDLGKNQLSPNLEFWLKKNDYTYGGLAKFAFNYLKPAIVLKSQSGYLLGRNFSIGLTHINSSKNPNALDTIESTIHHKLNDETSVALKIQHNFNNHENQLEFGGTFKVNDSFSLKAKVDEKFNVGAVFNLKLAKWLTLNLASKHEIGTTKDGAETFPVGIQLKIKN